jgi:hypothetical protein
MIAAMLPSSRERKMGIVDRLLIREEIDAIELELARKRRDGRDTDLSGLRAEVARLESLIARTPRPKARRRA